MSPGTARRPQLRDLSLSMLTRGDLISTDTNGVRLKAQTGDGVPLVARVDAVADGVIRVRFEAHPDLDFPVDDRGYPQAIVEIGSEALRVHAGGLTAELMVDPWLLRFADATGQTLFAQVALERRSGDGAGNPSGDRSGDRSGDGVGDVAGEPGGACHECFTARRQERFIWFGDSLYLSNLGYGVMVNSSAPVKLDIRGSDPDLVQVTVRGSSIDYYVLSGADPGQVLDRYNQLVDGSSAEVHQQKHSDDSTRSPARR
jgi:alpha-D-xyloside xylohydrolase